MTSRRLHSAVKLVDGGMPSTFLAELEESPAALHSLLAWHAGPGEARLRAFKGGLSGIRRVIVVGMGTSSFALLTLRDGLAATGVRLHAEEAGEWLHAGETPASGELLLLCSQSGESVELVRLAERGLPDGTWSSRIATTARSPGPAR